MLVSNVSNRSFNFCLTNRHLSRKGTEIKFQLEIPDIIYHTDFVCYNLESK